MPRFFVFIEHEVLDNGTCAVEADNEAEAEKKAEELIRTNSREIVWRLKLDSSVIVNVVSEEELEKEV